MVKGVKHDSSPIIPPGVVQDLPQPVRHDSDGLLPTDFPPLGIVPQSLLRVGSDERTSQAARRIDREEAGQALRAEMTMIPWVVGITLQLHDPAVLFLNEEAAEVLADAAGGPYGPRHDVGGRLPAR